MNKLRSCVVATITGGREHGRYGRVVTINGHSTRHLNDRELWALLAKLNAGRLPPEWQPRPRMPAMPQAVRKLRAGILASASRDGWLLGMAA